MFQLHVEKGMPKCYNDYARDNFFRNGFSSRSLQNIIRDVIMITNISGYDKAVRSYASSQQSNSAGDILFNKLSSVLGSDGTTITKEQVESYVQKHQNDSNESNDVNYLLNKLLEKWDSIAKGADHIKQSDLSEGLIYLRAKATTTSTTATTLISKPSKDDSDGGDDSADEVDGSIMESFANLAAAVGAFGGKITKEQLMSFLQKLETNSNPLDAKQHEAITFVKNVIAQFDNISNGANYITSLVNLEEPQDYETVTSQQVTPPVDIKV